MGNSTDTGLRENQSLLEFFMLSEGIEFKSMSEKMINVFRQRREEHDKKMVQSIENMRHTKKLIEVQVEMLSMRQRMLEDSHILLDKITELRKEYRIKKGMAYERIISDMQLRMKTTGEKEAIVEGAGEIAELKHKITILENQTAFYSDSIRTVDNILYGIKTRLDVENLLGT